MIDIDEYFLLAKNDEAAERIESAIAHYTMVLNGEHIAARDPYADKIQAARRALAELWPRVQDRLTVYHLLKSLYLNECQKIQDEAFKFEVAPPKSEGPRITQDKDEALEVGSVVDKHKALTFSVAEAKGIESNALQEKDEALEVSVDHANLPDFSAQHQELAFHYCFSQAFSYANVGRAFNNDDATSWYHLAVNYQALKYYGEALQHFDAALKTSDASKRAELSVKIAARLVNEAQCRPAITVSVPSYELQQLQFLAKIKSVIIDLIKGKSFGRTLKRKLLWQTLQEKTLLGAVFSIQQGVRKLAFTHGNYVIVIKLLRELPPLTKADSDFHVIEKNLALIAQLRRWAPTLIPANSVEEGITATAWPRSKNRWADLGLPEKWCPAWLRQKTW